VGKATLRVSKRHAGTNALLRRKEALVRRAVEAELGADFCRDLRRRFFPKLAAVLFRQPSFVTEHSEYGDWVLRFDNTPVSVAYGEFRENEVSILYHGRFQAETPAGRLLEAVEDGPREPKFPPLPRQSSREGRRRMVEAFVSPLAFLSFVNMQQESGRWDYEFRPGDEGNDLAQYLKTSCDNVCAGTFVPELDAEYPDSDLEVASRLKRGTVQISLNPPDEVLLRGTYRTQLWLHPEESPGQRLDFADSYSHLTSSFGSLRTERNTSRAVHVTDKFSFYSSEVLNVTSYLAEVAQESVAFIFNLATEFGGDDDSTQSSFVPGIDVPQLLRFPLAKTKSRVDKDFYAFVSDYGLPPRRTRRARRRRNKRTKRTKPTRVARG
jgi:hypothetical protein